MEDVLKGLAAFAGALFVFTLGLLAWRQQLLDKRKFEVAEALLLAFNKLQSTIEMVRATPPPDDMTEYLTKELRINPHDRYASYMGNRKWYYRITPQRHERLRTAFNEFGSAHTLASIYLPETTPMMSTLNTCYWQLIEAAKVLGEIDPRPPQDEEWKHMLHELPASPHNPDFEPTPESQIELETKHLWARYEDDPRDADAMNTIMWDAENKLEQACAPYIDQGPYEFLHRFLMTLWMPIRIWLSVRYRRISRRISPRK